MVVSAAIAGADFVGRERELGLLGELLDRAWAEEAHTVVVSGDSGVGKTALVMRACADHRGAGEALIGTCLPLTSMSIPFLPIRSALRANPHLVAPPEAPVDGGEREFALRFDAWLDEQTARTPVVLAVDDVQWADRSTLDTLMYAIAGPSSRRLAIVMTLRAGEVGLGHPLQRWLADIRRLPRTSELELGPLDRAATAAQIEALLGGSPHQSLIEEVYARSRGNPYFTRLLLADLTPEARAIPASLPSDLSSAVLQSWFRLSQPTRRLASVLAVGGRAMRADELARIADTAANGSEVRASLLEAVDSGTLDRLADDSFWFHHPLNAEVLEATLGEDERRDWHRRFADDIITNTSGTARSSGSAIALADHRYRAGQQREAFDAALAAAETAGAVSGHSEQLRLLRQAAHLRADLPGPAEPVESIFRRIRAVAAEVGAVAEELDAVEALLAMTDREAHPLVAAELVVRRVHLRFLSGQAFIELSDLQEAERLAAADPSDSVYALALAELAHAELWAGVDGAAEHAGRAVEIARAAGDLRALSHALSALVMEAVFRDASSTVREIAHEAVRAGRESRDWFAYVHALLWESNATVDWGTAGTAEAMRDGRLELEAEDGPHAYAAWLSAIEASNWVMIGRWHEAQAALRVALGSDPGPFGDVHARLAGALLATRQGRQDEAESHLLRVDELMIDGSAFHALEYDAVCAEVRLGSGDSRGAFDAAMKGATAPGSLPTMCEWLMPLAGRALADLAQRARDHGSSAVEPVAELDRLERRFPHVLKDVGEVTPIYRGQLDALEALYLAERLRARADPAESSAWLDAVDGLEACGFAWEEAYARARAAESLLGRDRNRQVGAEMLRSGLARARALGMHPVEAELLDLARRARVPVEEPTRNSANSTGPMPGLTAREREVLALLAVGRTYSEIARSLMISDKTVSTHVSHLLAKTGASNRVELARLVHRVTSDGDVEG
ncbi:AAA family ATPase [Agromyces sp. NPDC056523]|uniref:helix-turn-helix transcriptional regulator n=1 Tax=Agromyces sp. NPDC056523 TaxID=3345850 RepID=UPI00366C35F0